MSSIITYIKVAAPDVQIPKFAVDAKDTHGYIIDNTNIYFKCDNVVRVFNRTTGELRLTLEAHTSTITCLSMTGNILLSIDTNIVAKRWNTETGECVSTLTLNWEQVDYANRPVIRKTNYIQVAYAYNDKIIGACSDGIIRVWTQPNEPAQCNASVPEISVHGTYFAYSSNVVALIVHNDLVIVCCRNGNAELRIWDFKTTKHIADIRHYGSANKTSFMSITATDDTIFAGDYHGNIVSWCLKTLKPKNIIEPLKMSHINCHKSPILALHCQNDVLTSGKYVTVFGKSPFVSWHIIGRKKQAFVALLCMQRLDYPPEIIHEIMSHFHIVPHSAVNTYSADGKFA
jgi:WD40 repeat protein